MSDGDTMNKRLAVCGVAVVIGLALIITGISNVRTQSAEETGKRWLVNSALGRDNTYSGGTAVTLGVVRIVMGVAAIIFGIVFLYVGPFLA